MTNPDKNTKPTKDTKENPLAVSSLTQGKPTESNAIKIPKIEMPKGGGAIKSIDEKFQVNAVNGTASLSVPLPLSPGRNGNTPQLSLSYNSGGGNSEFGLGWNVGIPSIQRKTEKELPLYRDAEESDTFIIAGVEDLVPEMVEINGKWERVIIINGPKIIKRYRPRIEGLFSRIEKIEDSGNVYWKVTSKENVVSVYGETAKARIANPAEANQIFSWNLEYTYDDKGNFFRYVYKQEDDTNLPVSVSEKNRIGGLAPYTNTYLKSVLYGNRKAYHVEDGLPAPIQPEDFLFELVFDYGEHDQNKPKPNDNNPWTTRKDPYSSYRSGFEIRTYRRCNRVLMFHRFDELSPNPYLVRSLDFKYEENENFTYLEEVIQNGYIWKANGDLSNKDSLPPMSFTYAKNPFNQEVQILPSDSLHSFPVGLGSGVYQWTDLYSEGISGVLIEQGSGWYYKSNLGEGEFSPAVMVSPKPSFSGINNGALSIQELEGNGTKYLVQPGRNGGYFELNECEGWQPMQTFDQHPNLDLNDPNLKFLDVNGDGLPDIILSMENEFLWYAGMGKKGYDDYAVAQKAMDEEKGPRVLFSDGDDRLLITTMDMSGDGLSDIVLIQNNGVAYYPNLGYGRFGAKVIMEMMGSFDHDDQFSPDFIHFADIDGSGTTDIIYVGKNKIQVRYNHSGNSLSEVDEFYNPFPNIDSQSKITVLDLLGNGTSCIVWSSALPGDREAPLRYIDITKGIKPHVMTDYRNNMGKEVRVTYKPSTFYFLKDKKEGKAWVSKLPFPVQCVDQVITEDKVSQLRFANQYFYHHGYYDGVEREFRGFAMVEQIDTEEFEHYKTETTNAGALNVVREDLYQPAVITKSWFHTGYYHCRNKYIHQLQEEYYPNGLEVVDDNSLKYILPDYKIPEDITAYELSECFRALKGLPLRQEVYSDEGEVNVKIHPYTITQFNYNIQRLQPKEGQKHAIFLTTEKEKLSFALERNPSNQRISHNINIVIDPYGNVLQSAAIAYGRLTQDAALPSDRDRQKQGERQIIYNKNRFTESIQTTDCYRLPVPCEAETYELKVSNPAANYYQSDEILNAFTVALEKPYEQVISLNEKRKIELVRTLYLKDNLTGAMPFGKIDKRGLPFQNYVLAFTPGMIPHLYGTKVDDVMLRNTANYVRFEGDDNYWVRSGITHFHPDLSLDMNISFVPMATNLDVDFAKKNFFLPAVFEDQVGNLTKVLYDTHRIYMTRMVDALDNEVNVQKFSYRNLLPWLVADPNGNRKGVRYNVFGLPTSVYVMGKVTENKGDQMNIANEEDHADDRPSIKMTYEWFQYLADNNTANRVATLAYENHYFDDVGNAQAQIKTQRSFTYSDGSGNVVLEKVNAEPGDVTKYENGQKITTTTNTRWVGSGRTIVNNKGNPVKQYEPFFDDDEEYTREDSLVCQGYSPIIFYDALSRSVKQENPNGTFTKVVFDAWSQTHYDENDTVLESEWHATNILLPASDANHKAAKKTEIHADTPAKAFLDALGRVFLTIDHNKGQRSGEGIFETFNETRVDYDIESNPVKVIDARGNVVMSWKYEMLGHQVYQYSMDGGERWMLPDAMQRELRKWDSRGHMTAHLYDVLNRPLSNRVYDANGFITYEKYVYGETQPNPEVNNYRGQLYQLYDTGGRVQVNVYDFKGNVVDTERQLLTDYKNIPNWPNVNQDSLLNSRAFTTKTKYDALNRPVLTLTPDNSEHRPEYNEGGILEKVKVKIKGNGAVKTFVSNIDYNAKGQREKIVYGNNTRTSYVYDEKTCRLTKIETKKGNQFLQDLNCTYDPVGNITKIYDNAQKTIFYGGQKIQQRNEYTYDALYQLLEATGREHTGQVSHGTSDNWGDSWCRVNHAPGDTMNLRNYTQKYNYDQVGNIMQMRHVAQNGNWTRNYQYSSNNNHLTRTSVGNGSNHVYNYSYNIHGSIAQLSHMTEPILWNFREEMQAIEVGSNVKAYYQYDAQGQRIRKVIEKQGGLIEERLYLDGVEVYQERTSGSPVQLERETLHIQDDTGRIAMVDTLIIDSGVKIASPTPLTKYIYSNHLSTATLEADENGDIISYEEYHPFGTSSYTAVNASIQTTAKRYKYTGKERDEESGLYYHGARYYISWLGRWLSTDPAGLIDSNNLYCYVRNNPINFIDTTGHFEEPVHGALTYYLALAAGFTEKDAAHIALATAGVDHNSETKPTGHGFIGHTMTTIPHAVNGTTKEYHFPTFEKALSDVQTDIKKGQKMSLGTLGTHLHALQDVGFREAPGPHRRPEELSTKVITYGLKYTGRIGGTTFSIPIIPKWEISTSAHHYLGIGHPTYITEIGGYSNVTNHLADQAPSDPSANATELTMIYKLLKDSAKAYYGGPVVSDDKAAKKAIEAVIGANSADKVDAFLNNELDYSGKVVKSYSWWVDNNEFTKTKWKSCEIDSSIGTTNGCPQSPRRYTPMGGRDFLDNKTGKIFHMGGYD